MTISRLALPIAAVAALIAAPTTMASPSVLFSQSGGMATTQAHSARTADITLHTGHRSVLAFEQRPGRRTGTLAEKYFVGLWRGTFRTDAPNALLTGVDGAGRNHRVIVRISHANRTADGVRYRVRTLRGDLPPTLSPANLMIDSVPTSAVTAAALAYMIGTSSRVATYEPLINAMWFPQRPTVIAPQNITVTPGNPLTIIPDPVTTINAGVVTIEPDAQIVFMSPNAINLTFQPGAQVPCWASAGLVFAAQSVPSVGDPAPLTPVTTNAWSEGGGVCLLQWLVPAPPAPVYPTPVNRAGPPPMVTPTTFTSRATLTNTNDAPLVLYGVHLQVD